MRLVIRPMHDSEIPLVRDTWTRTIDANEVRVRGRREVITGRMRTVGGAQCPWLRVGQDAAVVHWAWHDMHRAWVQALWPDLVVLVATLPQHDEAVGWVALTPPGEHPLVLHYVYTVDLERARLRGIATQLVGAALEHRDHRRPRYSWMTPVGQRIVDRLTAAPTAPMRGEAAMH